MDWITAKLRTFNAQVACHEAQHAWTYAEFLDCVDRIAASIRAAALPPQTVLSIQPEHSIEGLAALIACTRTRLIAVPIPHELPEAERALNQATAHVEWTLHSENGHFQLTQNTAPTTPHPELFKQLAQRGPHGHSGLILFSSGTSAAPKVMLHDLDALLARYENVRPRNDRSLLLLLIDHIGGLDSAFRTLFAGATLIIPKQRTPESAAQAIATHQVNILPASPTFLNLMLLAQAHTKHNCDSVEIIAYGAEPMPQPLLQRLASAFPNADLQQKFGTSETGAIRIKSTDKSSLYFKIADDTTQWKVIDQELWLKTSSRILGYLNADSASLERDGWYRTGDLVETGPDDSLRIIGRQSALINIGGQKVHPAEIEHILNQHPQVDTSHVFAREDPITGSAITCELVTQSEHTPREWKRQLRTHCRGKLAPWKIPSSVTTTKAPSINHRMKRG